MRRLLIWSLKIVWFGIALGWAIHCLLLESWIEPLCWSVVSLGIGFTFDPPEG